MDYAVSVRQEAVHSVRSWLDVCLARTDTAFETNLQAVDGPKSVSKSFIEILITAAFALPYYALISVKKIK